MWFRALSILVHSPGFLDFTQLAIFESEKFVSSEITFADLPAGFCCSSCTPMNGRMFIPSMFARLSPTTISEVVLIVHPLDSIHPNDGILYPL